MSMGGHCFYIKVTCQYLQEIIARLFSAYTDGDRDIVSMVVLCWTSVADTGSTLAHHLLLLRDGPRCPVLTVLVSFRPWSSIRVVSCIAGLEALDDPDTPLIAPDTSLM